MGYQIGGGPSNATWMQISSYGPGYTTCLIQRRRLTECWMCSSRWMKCVIFRGILPPEVTYTIWMLAQEGKNPDQSWNEHMHRMQVCNFELQVNVAVAACVSFDIDLVDENCLRMSWPISTTGWCSYEGSVLTCTRLPWGTAGQLDWAQVRRSRRPSAIGLR